MRSAGLFWASFFSLLFHASFFIVSAIVLKHTVIPIDTATYMVKIVEGIYAPNVQESEPALSEEETVTTEPVSNGTMSYAADRLKAMRDEKSAAQDEKDHLAKRLKELEAKKRLEGIRASAAMRADSDSRTAGSETSTKIIELYYAKVREKILRAWIYPDLGSTNLKAIVSITVRKDGRIVTNRVEESSGNAVFDRSALRAIEKVSRVDEPPFGESLEIGVIFSPDEK